MGYSWGRRGFQPAIKPEVTRMPKGRRVKAEERKRRPQRSEEMIAAEDGLIRAASMVESTLAKQSEIAGSKSKLSEKENKEVKRARIRGEAI